jgi:hypothetical protein
LLPLSVRLAGTIKFNMNIPESYILSWIDP